MTQFTVGRYRTQLGAPAVVAQMRDVGRWVLRGCVLMAGVRYLTTWDINGKNATGDTKWDLVSGD